MGKLALTIVVIGALAAGAALSIDRATAISAVAAAKPGMPAPTFSVPDIAGKTVSLANFAGKIIILDRAAKYSEWTCRWAQTGLLYVDCMLGVRPA